MHTCAITRGWTCTPAQWSADGTGLAIQRPVMLGTSGLACGMQTFGTTAWYERARMRSESCAESRPSADTTQRRKSSDGLGHLALSCTFMLCTRAGVIVRARASRVPRHFVWGGACTCSARTLTLNACTAQPHHNMHKDACADCICVLRGHVENREQVWSW